MSRWSVRPSILDLDPRRCVSSRLDRISHPLIRFLASSLIFLFLPNLPPNAVGSTTLITLLLLHDLAILL